MGRDFRTHAADALRAGAILRPAAGRSRAQGATEYLMILGAVLLVAVVVGTLLGFFSGGTSDLTEGQSRTYWAGYAKPFSIYDSAYQLSGSCRSAPAPGIHVLVKNTEKWSLNLTGVYVNGNSSLFCIPGSTTGASAISFAPNSEMLVAISDNSSSLCTGRSAVSVSLVLRYASPYLSNKTQNGTVKLFVSCT